MPFIGGDGVVNGLVCMAAPFSTNTRYDEEPQYIPVPLTKVHVEARVVNFVSQIEVTQKYVNKEKNPIEAIYFFPVEEEAAVVDFTAELEGRIVKTVVKEKAKAKQDYQEAVRDRKTAFLLEETKPDVFQIQVGHLAPGSDCTITITYLSELPVEDGKTRLTVPTTIAPRYVPGDDKSEDAKKIASIEYDFKTPASMTFKLETIMKTRIKGIESPSHKVVNKIESESDNNNFFVGETRFEGSTKDMDRDIVFLIETDEPNEPKVILEKKKEGSTVAMISLVPSFQLKDITAEIVFLVDCSGSMSGKSINLAKEALQLFLHSLPMDCYFNIVCFGSSFQSLFPESKKYDDNTLDAAKQLAAKLSADLGGTEILRPLEHIFKQKPIPGNPRQVFVLTDGEVSDSSRCISCVKRNNGTSRVFTIGIGASADRHLVKGMARAGQGTAVFATYGEKIAPKVLKQLKNSLQPCISNVRVDWGDGVQQTNTKWEKPVMETTKTLMGFGKPKKVATGMSGGKLSIINQAPMNVPAIYDGSRLLVYKMLTNGKYPENIKVTAETPDGDLDLVLQVDKDNVLEGNSVHQMFARKLIQDLEESNKDPEPYYDEDRRDSENAKYIKSQIVELGIKYNLASKFTSFIGIDEKQGKESEVMMTRQIKNQVAHGYGGGFPQRDGCSRSNRSAPRMRSMAKCAPPAPLPMMRAAKAMSLACDSLMADSSEDEESAESFSIMRGIDDMEERSMNKRSSNPEMSQTEKLIQLTSLQIANGSFKRGEIIEKVTGKCLSEIDAAAGKNGVDKDAWLTAVVVMVIETKFGDDKDSWEMIVEKAKKWLKKSGKNYDGLFQQVKKFII